MDREYTRDEMLQWLEEYFIGLGYEVDSYSDRFLPTRVPLYCEKKDGGETDEIVIDITSDTAISSDDFFPTLPIGEVRIEEASPVRFYQYYFPKAKIYFAYPDYAVENDKFKEFKNICMKRGIGLLKTSEAKIEEMVEPQPLLDEICDQLVNNKKERKDIEDIVGNYLENYLHYGMNP